MKRVYNKSQEMQRRRPRFNARYWEIPMTDEVIARIAEGRLPWRESAEDAVARVRRQQRIAELMPAIHAMIETALTARQRDVVRLYFLQGLTVYEVAERLHVSAPSVSQHLFGKKRGGQQIGGAIARLRRAAAEAGVSW